MAPGIPELTFWAAVTMASSGKEDESIRYFRDVFRRERRWREVLRRLPAAGLLEDDQVERILRRTER
jgi:hypothetical protein